eukprot:gene27425-4722_t
MSADAGTCMKLDRDARQATQAESTSTAQAGNENSKQDECDQPAADRADQPSATSDQGIILTIDHGIIQGLTKAAWYLLDGSDFYIEVEGSTPMVYEAPQGPVRGYLLDGSDFYVEVEGGSRMVYEAPQCRVLPATFGLNVADAVLIHDLTPFSEEAAAELVEDLMPSNEEAAVELVEVSRSILHLLHKGAVLAAPDPRRESSRKFANAMFMASASRDPSGGEGEGGASAAEASQSEGFKLEAADLDKVCNKLDVKAAQSLSILLSPFLPVDFDLRRRWFRSLDSVSRSKEQLQQMSDHPNLGMATAAAILKKPGDSIPPKGSAAAAPQLWHA